MVEKHQWNRRDVMKLFGAGTGAALTMTWARPDGVVAQDATPCAVPGPDQGGGTLTVGQVQDLLGFDPFQLSFTNYSIMHQLYDRLIKMDNQMNVNPWLAESWDIPDDGTSITFHLRSGVKFHSGRDLTAQDVVDNLERARVEDTGGNIYPKVQTISSIEAPDPSTVVVNFSAPTPNVFDIFDSICIADPEAFENLRTQPVGTGPFKFKEWIPGDRVVYERFDEYWQENIPYLDEVIIKPFADGEALTTALESGQIDAGISLPFKDYQRLQEAEDVVVETGQDGALVYILVINPPDPSQEPTPLSDKRVRQAINFAVNRQTIIDQALFGVGLATVTPFPEGSLAYFPEFADRFTFDLDRARELLAEAGYADGFDMEIMFSTSSAEYSTMGQIVAADLAQIGINVTLAPLEAAVWTPRLFAGEYQATFTGIGRSHKDPLGLWDNSPFRVNNSPVWPEGDFPAGYAEAIQAASTTTDVDARRESFRQLNEIMLDECVQISISLRYTLFAWRSDVNGFGWSPDDEIKVAEAWKGEC